MSIASLAASTGTTATSASAAASTAQTTLNSNYQTFLKMLMTQLQNQDPTSPMDSSQFTQQLVEYSSVEQQIQTNSNLGTLISLSQSNQVMQSAGMVGHQVSVTSNQLSLQNGQAELQFNATQAGPVAISVTNATGSVVGSATVQATKGTNTWTWNGANAQGVTNADGAYNVTVTNAASGANNAAIPFTVVGTATGVAQSNGTANLSLGALTVPFANIVSVQN